MKATILAAGRGLRIASVTDNPKCLLEVGGETILDRQLRLLDKSGCNPTIITGYKAGEITKKLGWSKRTVYNPLWKHSNTLVSMLIGMEGSIIDTVVINGDTVFSNDILPKMLDMDYSVAAVRLLDSPTSEEMKVRIAGGNRIIEIGKDINSIVEAVGVYLFRAPLLRAMVKAVKDMGKDPINAYYEDAVNMVLAEHPMSMCQAEYAVEIDTPEDYERAREIYEHCNTEEI